MPNLIIGSRGSKLALWQAHWVKSELERIHDGLSVDIEIIKTTGDKLTEASLAKMPGKGAFTKEIEEALFDKRVDLAVHSLKDLPTILPDGLHISAIPLREDPRDALIVSRRISDSVKSIEALPPNPKIGTSSPRRAAQLRQLRPDAQIFELRGNVETRLRKLEDEGFDAIILAAAGLRRLGFKDSITQLIPLNQLLPAVGQGALGIEACVNDDRTNYLLEKLNHWPTRNAVEAERAVLRGLGGGCAVPVAAYAHIEVTDEQENLRLEALVSDLEGKRLVRQVVTGPQFKCEDLGKVLARHLIAAGAYELLNSGPSSDVEVERPVKPLAEEAMVIEKQSIDAPARLDGVKGPLSGATILVTRAKANAGNLAQELELLGAEVVTCPTIEIRPPEKWDSLDTAIRSLDKYDWLAFTSVNGVNYFLQRLDDLQVSRARLASLKICAVGERTATRLVEEKLQVDLTPQRFSAENLVSAFLKKYGVGHRIRGAQMLLPAAKSTRDIIRPSLEKVGVTVDVVEAYQNLLPDYAHEAVHALIAEAQADYVVFTSPSTVNNLAVMLDTDDLSSQLGETRIACIGPVTAEAAIHCGLMVSIQPEEHTVKALVDALVNDRAHNPRKQA